MRDLSEFSMVAVITPPIVGRPGPNGLRANMLHVTRSIRVPLS
jgi:hypothetical protein